jgi:hypothetical protein
VPLAANSFLCAIHLLREEILLVTEPHPSEELEAPWITPGRSNLGCWALNAPVLMLVMKLTGFSFQSHSTAELDLRRLKENPRPVVPEMYQPGQKHANQP